MSPDSGLTAEICLVDSWGSKTWAAVGEMVVGRFGFALVNVGGKVLAVGGDTREGPAHYLDSIEVFDSTTQTWSLSHRRLKYPRSNFAFSLLPHSLFPGCRVNRTD